MQAKGEEAGAEAHKYPFGLAFLFSIPNPMFFITLHLYSHFYFICFHSLPGLSVASFFFFFILFFLASLLVPFLKHTFHFHYKFISFFSHFTLCHHFSSSLPLFIPPLFRCRLHDKTNWYSSSTGCHRGFLCLAQLQLRLGRRSTLLGQVVQK